ncbi:MAG: ABC transporter ATP-binding protein [Dehalococcoidales bacterium]|nr:ABC transporter ATP-binding protein [Dehalococcoidales bacterium]
MDNNYIIETNGLTKKYDGVPAVDGLDLHVKEGEVFGLLGPNGAGKTTTILMLLGLTEPFSGSAAVCGFNPSRQPLQVKRLTGYMPEKVGFYENMTARENLQFIAELNNIPDKEISERANELMKAVGILDVADEKVGKYSKGMKQRLGIADVLIKSPKLAILDEPTSGLDPDGIVHITQLIGSLPKRGTSVILSSHQLFQVQKVCNRVAIIAKGKLVVEGSIAELGRKATAGQCEIEVETKQPTPELVEKIKELDSVIKVDIKGDILLVCADTDLRPDLAKIVVQSNLPLIQMKIQQLNLDDIYMKYFQEKE